MSTLTTAIPNLLVALDDEFGGDFSRPAMLLMFLDDFGLGTKVLAPGQHPLDELLGFVAPDDCFAIGAICHGWATQLADTRPSRASDRRRLRALHVVCRDGRVIGGLHLIDQELALRDDAVGIVPDALRRTLGLATPPPEVSAAELSAADWLDAVAEDVTAVDNPPEPYTTWDEPRWEVITRKRLVADLTATVAAWMDEGIFARWMAATYPRTSDHLAAVRRVVDDGTYRRIRRRLTQWGLLR